MTDPAREHGFAPPASASWAGLPSSPPPAGPGPARPTAGPEARLPRIALWCGIIALLGGVLYGWTLPVAVLAIVLGTTAIARGGSDRRRSLIALVFGLIGLALSGAWLVYSLLILTRVLAFTS